MLSIRCVSYSEFDAFSLTHPRGNFHQTSQMGVLRELMGWDVHPLLAFDGDTTVGAFLLAGKAGRYEVTMGPLLDFSDTQMVKAAFAELEVYAKKQNVAVLDIYPYELYQTRDSTGKVLEKHKGDSVISTLSRLGWKHKGFTTSYDVAANRWVFVKDLSSLKNEEDLLRSYRQTTRQIIRKQAASDYSVRSLKKDELATVQQLIDSSNEKNSVATRPLEYYERLFDAFGENIEFLVVYYQKKTPLSAGIFIRHANEMVYFMSGADSSKRHLYGGHFLQHYMMKRCLKEGVQRYNFYGVSGHFTNNPLLVYKAGFRGVVEEYVGGFTKTLSPTKAALMKAKRVSGKIRNKVRR